MGHGLNGSGPDRSQLSTHPYLRFVCKPDSVGLAHYAGDGIVMMPEMSPAGLLLRTFKSIAGRTTGELDARVVRIRA
jgi:hypothetical protein